MFSIIISLIDIIFKKLIFISIFMDPREFAEHFDRLMVGIPIIAYELISREDAITCARVLTTRPGLDKLASLFSETPHKSFPDIRGMCKPINYRRAEIQGVWVVDACTDAGYYLSAYALD